MKPNRDYCLGHVSAMQHIIAKLETAYGKGNYPPKVMEEIANTNYVLERLFNIIRKEIK